MHAQKAVCYDTHSCINCYACMVGCAQENRVRLQRDRNIGVKLSVNGDLSHLTHLWPIQHEVGRFPNSRRVTQFQHCHHCESAPCQEICPTNAIVKRPNGAVVISERQCIGCRACYDACPYNVPQYDRSSGKAYKCTMCYDRVEAGHPTACVDACVTGALFMGDRDEVLAEAERRARNYRELHDEEYVVYGKDKLNNVVGKTGWVTITPELDQEVSGLYRNPYKAAMVGRSLGHDLAVFGITGTALAILAHSFWWRHVAADDDGHGKSKVPRGQVRFRHEHEPEHEKTQKQLTTARSVAHKVYDRPDSPHTLPRGEVGDRHEK